MLSPAANVVSVEGEGRMARLKFAVALAAVLATGAFAGQAGAGVHVMTVSAVPVHVGVWQPGTIPKFGVDVFELRASPEVEGAVSGGTPAKSGPQGYDGGWTNRSKSWQKEHDDEKGGHGHHGGGGHLSVPAARGSNVSGSPSGLNTWHGLDHWDERFGPANQFSLEPPDQGLCVANGSSGQVLEVVNGVIRSFMQNGTATSPQISLNEFFGYPDAIDRANKIFGPFVTDPSCIFDQRAQKYVVVALTLEVVSSGPNAGNFTGNNHLDIAVTTAAEPTVAVQRYMIPVQNTGTEGTPTHPHCPCIGDFPQFGMDEFGLYITTNEYSFFGTEFNGAQIYAFSRKQLEAGSPVLRIVHFDGLTVAGNPAFTVWPAKSNEGDYNRDKGGTENFLSSMAAPEADNPNGIDNRIAVWWLKKTWGLDTPAPEAVLQLSYQVDNTETYAIPPPSDQKVGNIPLADCLNHDECSILINGEPDQYKPEVEGPLDSSDTRMLTHWFINGQLLGALDTALKVNGQTRAGIAWFAFDASSGRLQAQSYLAVANNNVIYPAIATLSDGRGAMAFTLAGRDWYPSAAYSLLQAAGNGDNGDDDKGDDNGKGRDSAQPGRSEGNGRVKVGNPTLASPGIDAQDGFSESKYYSPTGDGIPRPRWGDFGAAASTGTDIWIASEYIGQTCGTSDWHHFAATNFWCFDSPNGHLRTLLANWGTRVTQVILSAKNEKK
jgi:hypothetical protein